MAKTKKTFSCEQCGSTFPRWAGRCESCGSWNSIVEVINAASSQSAGGQSLTTAKLKTSSAKSKTTKSKQQLSTEMEEVNQFLGGGIVNGSVILVAGEPGIGKSTLLMQLSSGLAKAAKVLYVSAEESAEQVSLRANRLKVGQAKLEIASSTSTDDIIATMMNGQFDVVVVDSIQTVSMNEVKSAPGSPSQINSSAHSLINIAKSTNTVLVLVGHVTKQGSIAGPKLLEHIVDVVLNIEGERYHDLRVLRSVKNRFGSTNESVIFEMQDEGLKVVDNPSEVLLAERKVVDGSVILAAMDGNRPILVEVQALVNKTQFGYPKRTASGFDLNRLNLLIAVLTKRTKLNLNDSDVYVNVVGGFKLSDPGADVAVAMAIASAAKGLALDQKVAVFGEIGLGGELRRVRGAEKRIKEAAKLGYTKVVGPKLANKQRNYHEIATMREALNSELK